LNITDAYIKGTSSGSAIADKMTNSNLENCHVSGTFLGAGYAGSIVGSMNNSKIENCSAKGIVELNILLI
jgi:hypothetical protein